MCGILGRYAPHGNAADVDALCEATDRLRHRGPDDGGWWSEGPFFLGHRRLSIIDLEQGAQPMASIDGRFVIAFNGEIYNFVELRTELSALGAQFATRSDTEVILNGYRAWGADVARHLVGMFAFAIADRVEGTLYLARDRFGEKPLFVHESGTGISFASELGALASLPGFARAVDPAALGAYLCLNYVPGDRSLMAGVRRLAPGTWRRYTRTGAEQARYWSPPASAADVTVDPAQAATELAQHIDESIRIALRSDVPVALFLSGGIDSAIIAESAARQGRLAHAYCLDFAESGFSEWDNAAAVARTLGIELRRATLGADALADFFAIVEHADDPLGDASALAVWALAREVARDYKVVITGDGGDELFGGYLTYRATLFQHLVAAGLPRFARRGLRTLASRLPVGPGKVSPSYRLMRFLRAANLPPAQAHFTWNGSFLPTDAARLLREPAASHAAAALAELCASHALTDAPDFGALQRADAAEYLPNDILVKVDRMTMAHGLEARAPFLVPRVAEYAFGLPDRLKIARRGPTKRILRELAARRYGPRIAEAKKQGFSIPVHQWLRGPARDLVENLLSPHALADFELLDADAVLRAKALHASGRAELGFELWGLMVLVAWHRARIAAIARPARHAGLPRLVFPLGGSGRSDALAAAI